MTSRLFPWLLAAFVSLSAQLPSRVSAQNPEVSASLLGKKIALGEQGTFLLRVINAQSQASPPPSIEAEGLKITYSASDQSFKITNGVSQSEQIHYYQVVGEKAGSFTIPAVKVQVDGQELSTLPVEFTVFTRKPGDAATDASRPFFVKLDIPQPDLYVGQLIPLNLIVYVRGQRSINDVGPPDLEHDAFVINKFKSIDFDGVDLDGIPFSTATLPGSLFPLTAGEHTMGPAELAVRMIESGHFGALTGFFQSTRVRKLQSNSLTLKVHPLPEAGKPDSFRGAVGTFQLSASASPVDLKVGDPISIEFEVTGIGNFDSVEGPVFLPSNPTEWRTYEARKIIDPAETSNGVTPGKATFSQIVMPQAVVAEIPRFELAFFDPSTGAYAVQQTDPIAIRVQADASRPTVGMTAPLLTDPAAGSGFATPAAALPVPQFSDILFIQTGSPRWRAMPAAITERPLFWVAQAVAIVVFLFLVWLIVRQRLRESALDSNGLNPHPSFRQCVKRLPLAENRSAFYRLVESALDAWERERKPRPGPLPPAITSKLTSLRSRCQRVLHGGPLAEETQPMEPREADEIRGLLDQLGKAIS